MALTNWQDLLDSAEESTEYTPLPEGDFVLRVLDSSVVESQTGKTGYRIECEVADGDYTGRKVFNTFYVSPESPKAMGIFFRHMGALGLDGDFFRQSPSDDDIADALVDEVFVGVLKHAEKDGKTYTNIADCKVYDGEGVPAAQPKKGPSAPSKAVKKGPPVKKGPSRKGRTLPSSPSSSPI